MKYNEAREKSFTVKWEAALCPQGEECWCRMVRPADRIFYEDGDVESEFLVIGSGEMDTETAEYLVKLHNNNLQ